MKLTASTCTPALEIPASPAYHPVPLPSGRPPPSRIGRTRRNDGTAITLCGARTVAPGAHAALVLDGDLGEVQVHRLGLRQSLGRRSAR